MHFYLTDGHNSLQNYIQLSNYELFQVCYFLKNIFSHKPELSTILLHISPLFIFQIKYITEGILQQSIHLEIKCHYNSQGNLAQAHLAFYNMHSIHN
jgi:hypothetical protein